MKIKKRTLKLILLIFFLLLTAYIAVRYLNKGPYKFEGDKFSYSQYRGQAEYQISLLNKTGNIDIFAVNFLSKNFLGYETRIYGLLFMPRDRKNIPGLVLLPGGGVSKEDEASRADIIAGWGYAVLVIDQRGIGETGGYYLGMEQDYQIFLQGKEPIQHLSIYDALKTFDVLARIKGVDKSNIAIAGESMGGRYAIIAAAIEKRLKGIIVISSSGFHAERKNRAYDSYLLSIDPDHYIGDISPRPVFMLHGSDDRTVPLEDAELTFDKAKEPKRFFIAEGCEHGYCSEMEEELKEDLKILFGN